MILSLIYFVRSSFRKLFPAVLLIFLSFPLRAENRPSKLNYKVEAVYFHDPQAYTQGLFFEDGVLYESTGQYGSSSFRKVDLKSGKVLENTFFDAKYFAEGSCMLNGLLYILTWQEHVCLVYNPSDMRLAGTLPVHGEGWGLTTDGTCLIMSDGTSEIRFLDPLTFMERKRITVRKSGKPVNFINELEYIDGRIWANIYLTDEIIVIDPADGKVESVLDLSKIYPVSERPRTADVLNGIAYDERSGKIYVTGKLWPKLFEISVY